MAEIATLKTKDVMSGMSLRVTLSRGFTIRTRIACWLIGLAGRVIDVPAEIEMREDGLIRPGDVVIDRFDRKLMTVEYLHEHKAYCVWFDDQSQLHRRTYRVGSLEKADAQG